MMNNVTFEELLQQDRSGTINENSILLGIEMFKVKHVLASEVFESISALLRSKSEVCVTKIKTECFGKISFPWEIKSKATLSDFSGCRKKWKLDCP